MKQKIAFSIIYLFFSFFSFSNYNLLTNEKKLEISDAYRTMSPILDKALLKNEVSSTSSQYVDAKLIKSELVKINDIVYVALKYDVEIKYKYKNNNIISSVHYDIYHPIIVNEKNMVLAETYYYLEKLLIYSEEQVNRKFDKYEVIMELENDKFKGHFLLDVVGNRSLEKEDNNIDVVIDDEVEYLPYIEYNNGYAYIKGTDIKVTSQNNIMISYFPKEDISLVEIVDYDNGRFITRNLYHKSGKVSIEEISEDKEIIIKNTVYKYENGLHYNDEEKIAKLVYKDKKLESYEILKK